MTLTIDLTPEEERRVEEAQRRGVDVLALIKDVIAGLPEASETEESKRFWETATQEEWHREFHAWLDSHDPNTPVVSEEALSRESIYGMRGL